MQIKTIHGYQILQLPTIPRHPIDNYYYNHYLGSLPIPFIIIHLDLTIQLMHPIQTLSCYF